MSERIDHIVINIEGQLDASAEQYTRLGFALTPRGHHSRGTSNHLAIFGDDYLELIGYEAGKESARWDHPEGLVGLVFKIRKATEAWASLSSRGVALEGDGPTPLQRPVIVNGEHLGEASFSTFRIAADSVPNGRVFFCQHDTPELVWRKEWQTHPNGAQGIAEYVYVSANPEKAAGLLIKAFGDAELTREADGVRFQAGPSAILFLTPDGVAKHFGIDVALVPQGIERAVGLTVRVASLELTRQELTKNGVSVLPEKEGKLVVTPDQAFGVILAFS